MEISDIYNKTLELEGLLFLLNAKDTDQGRLDLIFNRLFEKIDDINADLTALHRQFHAINPHKSATEAAPIGGADHYAAAEDENVDAAVEESDVEEIVDMATSDAFEKRDGQPSCAPAVEQTVETPSDDATQVAENALYEEAEDAGESDVESNVDNTVNIVIDGNGVDVNQSLFAIKARGDIRKAFTLNDNYKFRRQLFANSQEDYSNALSAIEKMRSTCEAEDYFYNGLHWDRDNQDVKDFMNIVSAYFLGK